MQKLAASATHTVCICLMYKNVREDNTKLNRRVVVCERDDKYGLFQFWLQRLDRVNIVFIFCVFKVECIY